MLLEILSFLLSVTLLSLTLHQTLPLFNFRSWVSALIAGYLFVLAYLVLIGTLLGLLQVMDKIWAYLLLQGVLLALAVMLNKKFIQKTSSREIPISFLADFKQIGTEKALLVLAVFVAIAYIYNAILIVLVPQNNMDSLSTHLSRIGYWLHQATFLPWATPQFLQLIYPPNAQFALWWHMLFLKSDVFVGLLQWAAALVSAAAVFGLSTILGFSRRAGFYAAFLFLGFPLVALQASTTQTDLVVMSLFVAAVYFLWLNVQQQRGAHLWLSALAIGLGLGVKQTYFFYIPAIVLLAWAAMQNYRPRLRAFFLWGAKVLTAFLLFGSVIYFSNLRSFGNPFGPPEVLSKSVGDVSSETLLSKLGTNIARLAFQSIDTSGLPRPVDGYSHKVKALLASTTFNALGWHIEGKQHTFATHVFSFDTKNIAEESHAWYGPLSVLLLFPAILYTFVVSWKRKQVLLLSMTVSFWSFWVIEVLARPGWDPYQGRYFAGIVALNAPLMAIWFEQRRKGYATLTWFSVLLTGIVLFTALTYNPAKPSVGKWADDMNIWTSDRVFLQSIQMKDERSMFYLIENKVSDDATLGVYRTGYLLDYPLFGERLNRRVVTVYPQAQLSSEAWLKEQQIEFLLIQNGDDAENLVAPTCLQVVAMIDGWQLRQCCFSDEVVP